MEIMPANLSKPTINANTPTWLPLPVAVENLAAASRFGMDKVTGTLVPVAVIMKRVLTSLKGMESRRAEKKTDSATSQTWKL